MSTEPHDQHREQAGQGSVDMAVLVKHVQLASAETVARLFESDPHLWSTRPCQTCRAISGILDRPFGCIAYAKQRGVPS